MNVTVISIAVALLLAIGLVVGLGVLSLLSGAMDFVFGRPKLKLLRSKQKNGFAFGLKFNEVKEPVKFDMVQVRLFNPFGEPTQVEMTSEFSPQGKSFAEDIDFGESYNQLTKAKGIEESIVTVTLSSSKDGVSFPFNFKGPKFFALLEGVVSGKDEFQSENTVVKKKPLYQTNTKSFIAEPLPKSNKSLKIATNPEFAGEFSGDSGKDAGEGKENFSITKVWIEPGCIVCDACETIYPEVFDVQDDTCIVRPDYPKENGLLVEEAVDACPVEVIKFTKSL